jgi:3-deoxy-D-manno-octulosonic-acid transferase
VKTVDPQMAVFVKYEYWFNYMHALHRQAIPLYVVSAIFRPNQHFFKWWGTWFAYQLSQVSHFFVQNQTSCDLLESLGSRNYTLCGDTRFDRVYEILQNRKSFPLIATFCESNKDSKIWVLGSSWHPDELLFASLIAQQKEIRVIIAPHEIDEGHIREIQSLFVSQRVVRYTEATLESAADADILLIDTMGMLSQIYQYAHIAYIGGGFGVGIHNILEAAVYAIPVIFGPKYRKFDEAVSLIAAGGAFSVNSGQELEDLAHQLMTNADEYRRVSESCSRFVEQNLGATDKILSHILPR